MTPRDSLLKVNDVAPVGVDAGECPSGAAENDTALPPVEVDYPARRAAPVILASPHSGRDYPPAFVEASRLGPLVLRRSEDAFVDELFGAAPDFGVPLVRANFPRAYVDANREAFELDPAMFDGPLPDYVTTQSARVAAGLGTVARIVANGENIYDERLSFPEVAKRIRRTYHPYHDRLRMEVDATLNQFGGCLLIDCHSMPSSGVTGFGRRRQQLADIVLGDCHGASATAALVNRIEKSLSDGGFRVVRNKPYAGGFTTRRHGHPRAGCHAVQIEINRALYLDEERITRLPAMSNIKTRLEPLLASLADITAQDVAARP